MGNFNNKSTVTESNPSPSSISSESCRRRYSSSLPEQFILVWLDRDALKHSLDSLRTKTLLQRLNKNHCSFFDKVECCLSEIKELCSNNKKIFLVVSGSFASQILPEIKETISTVIIFCHHSDKYKELMTDNSNVIDICTDHDALETSIQRELPSLKFNLFSNQKLTSLRLLTSSSNAGNNSTYFSYMLFIDFLKQMPQTNQAKDVMLKKCEDYYRNNETVLKWIKLFRNTYTSDTAIDWYLEDSFVYRLVNTAFRTEDITLWYLFRYYISDLCTQLERVHQEQNCQSFLTLYRGQSQLPTKELQYIQANVGGLISTNAFFSTSTNPDIARRFIFGASHTEDFKVVLFEITVDALNLNNIIFVDINKYLRQPSDEGEGEVLFNIGSVFQVESVNHDDKLNVWRIKMKATDEGTDSIKARIEQIKTKFQNGNINLLFGRLLIDMNHHIKAESYFQMLINVLPKSHPDLPLVYDYIGDLHMHTTNWNKAFKNFHLAYEIKKKKSHSNHRTIGVTLNNLGNYYKAIRDNHKALEYYLQVLTYQNNPYNRAITLLNMSTIYIVENDLDQAIHLRTEAQDIIDETSSSTSIAMIQCHLITGSIYLAQREYQRAKDAYLNAFEMSENILFIDDRHRIVCIKAITNLYHQQNMKQQAIAFCLSQLMFYEYHLTEYHINMAYLFIIIAELYEDNEKERINFLKKALDILQENLHLHYETTASCMKLIGQYYQKQNLTDQAIEFYGKTLEIYQKIYPQDHFTIKETKDLIGTTEK